VCGFFLFGPLFGDFSRCLGIGDGVVRGLGRLGVRALAPHRAQKEYERARRQGETDSRGQLSLRYRTTSGGKRRGGVSRTTWSVGASPAPSRSHRAWTARAAFASAVRSHPTQGPCHADCEKPPDAWRSNGTRSASRRWWVAGLPGRDVSIGEGASGTTNRWGMERKLADRLETCHAQDIEARDHATNPRFPSTHQRCADRPHGYRRKRGGIYHLLEAAK
jgi:hypothetical protein